MQVSGAVGVASLDTDDQKRVEEHLQHTRDVLESEPFEGVLRYFQMSIAYSQHGHDFLIFFSFLSCFDLRW